RDLIVRRAVAVRGRPQFELDCFPSFDYARAKHQVELVEGVGAVVTSSLGYFVLRSRVPLTLTEGTPGGPGIVARFTLEEGESLDFELEWNGIVRPMREHGPTELLERTTAFWQHWIGQSR